MLLHVLQITRNLKRLPLHSVTLNLTMSVFLHAGSVVGHSL